LITQPTSTIYDQLIFHPFTQEHIRIKARQLCRRSDFSKSDFPDLKQEMLLYLWSKAHLFDPTRGTIEAFVTETTKSCIAMILRRRDRMIRRGDIDAISLEGTLIEHDGVTDMLKSVLDEADFTRRTQQERRNPIDLYLLQESVRQTFRTLTPDQQDLLVHIVEHSLSSASREWTRREQRRVTRHEIEKRVLLIRSRFKDAGLSPD